MNALSTPRSSPPPTRALVIFNPTAGRRRRRRFEETLDLLRAGGCIPTVMETMGSGDAERAARSIAAGAFDLVIAAGGDGTVNEVANGLAGLNAPPPIGLIPLGTANVLAAELGLAPTARAAAQAILAGKRRVIHPGLANGRYFVLMASAGLDAEVVAGLDPAFKRRVGRLAYVWESLVRAVRYDFPPLSILADGRRFEARMAVVCKGRCYGGPFVAARAARLDAPLFHLVLMERGGFINVFRYGVALALGRIDRLADVRVIPVRHAVITGIQDAPVQADGDLAARLPVEIGLAARTLELVGP